MKLEMGKDFAEEQRQRLLKLEQLYVLDGRHHKDHALHGLYTGLADKAKELEADLDEGICDI